MRRDEVAALMGERQEQLAGQTGVGAQLQVGRPFGAVVIELGHHKACGGIEGGIAGEVILQAQPKAHVVGSPGVAPRPDRQTQGAVGIGRFSRDQTVFQRFQRTLSVVLAHAPRQQARVQGPSHQVSEGGLYRPCIGIGTLVQPDEVHDRMGVGRPDATCQIALVRLRWQREGRQLLPEGVGGRLAPTQRHIHTRKIKRGVIPQHRIDDHVPRRERGALAVAVAADQDCQHLVGDTGHGTQLVARGKRKADIDHNQHVDVHCPRDVDRQVLGDATVDQQAPFPFDRSEDAGRRDTRAQGRGQIALRENHCLAGFQVGGHGAKRGGQLVEVGGARRAQGQLAQQAAQLLALDQAPWQEEPALAESQRQLHQELLVLAFAAEVQVAALGPVAEGVLPIDAGEDLLDLTARPAAGVQTANDRAHAGAGDGINGHMQLIQDFEYAHVGRPPGPAAGQHQADPRSHRRHIAGNRRLRPCRKLAGEQAAAQQEPQQVSHPTSISPTTLCRDPRRR